VGWPQFLPGGKRLLYVDLTDGKQNVRLVDADGKNAGRSWSGLSRVEYAPPGYLLFVRDTTLVAQGFDAGSGKLQGEPVPVAEDLGTDAVGLADFSASRTGVLAYRAGRAGQTEYVWFDHKGTRARRPWRRGTWGLRPLRGRALARLPDRRHQQRRPLDAGPQARRVLALHLREGGREHGAPVPRQHDRLLPERPRRQAHAHRRSLLDRTGEERTLLEREGRLVPALSCRTAAP
jgi:hypothetical protein